jgi:hypothetical protein
MKRPVSPTLNRTGFLFCLFVNPEDGADIFLRNVSLLSMDYTALYHRIEYFSKIILAPMTLHFRIAK